MLFEVTSTQAVFKGEYAATASMTSGSVTLSYSVDGLPAQDIDSAAWTANATNTIKLPECNLTVTLTGDAKFSLLKI